MKRRLITHSLRLLTFLCILSACTDASGRKSRLNVWSYNMLFDYNWVAKSPDQTWCQRMPHLMEAIRQHRPDIIGTQELQTFQVRGVVAMSGYGWVGVSMKGNREGLWAENAAIFYNRDRLEVVDEGNFWFSETPNTPRTYSWGMKYCRMCTWGKFRDRQTGHIFALLNSHFYVDADKEEARKHAARLVLSKAKEFLQEGIPVICTGDLNATIDNESVQILLQDGTLKDTYALARHPRGPQGSFHGFGKYPEPKKRIDHVLVSSAFRVKDYEIIDEQLRTRQWQSDHLPVSVVLSY